MLEKGTYKVVWITKDTKKIYSKMFSSISEAKIFGTRKKDYLIFRLIRHKNFREYSWQLMPFGNHKIYESALKFYNKHKSRKFIIERMLRI